MVIGSLLLVDLVFMGFQMNTTRAFENLTTIHSLAFIGIAAAAVILHGAGLLDTIERQLILLALLLPFAGIPHGSLDYSIARDMLEPRLSRRCWPLRSFLRFCIPFGTALRCRIYSGRSTCPGLWQNLYALHTGDSRDNSACGKLSAIHRGPTSVHDINFQAQARKG